VNRTWQGCCIENSLIEHEFGILAQGSFRLKNGLMPGALYQAANQQATRQANALAAQVCPRIDPTTNRGGKTAL
jgi:hypothetical protein